MRRLLLTQVAALASSVGILACGGASQLDTSGPSGGTGAAVGRDASVGGATIGDATSAVGGQSLGGRASSGGASGSAGAGTGAESSSAGGGSGSGNGGTGSGNGGAAASNGAGGSPGTGGANVEADAGSPLVDPRAEQRKTLAEDYCAVCSDGQPDCASRLNIEWFNDFPVDCWDELAASERCSKDNHCAPLSGGQVGGGACLAERTALDTCIVTKDRYRGVVTGSMATCNWRRLISGTSCEVVCPPGSDTVPWKEFETQCSGPPDGPFQCLCSLNGRGMSDSMIPNGTQFYVDTCQMAGQMLADGYCHKFVDCCYTFTDAFAADPSATACECTSDPTPFKSCQELAASHTNGKVIDLCPGYQPGNVVP